MGELKSQQSMTSNCDVESSSNDGSYAQKYRHPLLHTKKANISSLICLVAAAYGIGVTSAFISPTTTTPRTNNQLNTCFTHTNTPNNIILSMIDESKTTICGGHDNLRTFGVIKRTTTTTRNNGSSRIRLLSSNSDLETQSQSSNAYKPDEDEWKALLAAFHMYKAAYGDLKVPSRFVVPAMPPWPENSWSLKLGQRVAAIRSTGKYVQDDDERRKILDDMSFLWRLRAPSPDKKMDVTFDQIFDALQTFRTEIQTEGSLNVPANFIVPNYDPWPETTRGMPLGKKIPTVRSKAFLNANPGAKEKLLQIGFQLNGKVAANDARYNLVYNALVRYKEIHGDLLVPQPFIIPETSEDWPEEARGLRLGARVNAIRSQGTFVKTNPERREQLDKLGFEWELPSATGVKRGRKKKTDTEAADDLPPAFAFIDSSSVPGEAQTNNQDSIPNELSNAEFDPSVAFANDLFQIDEEQPSQPTWAFEDDLNQEQVEPKPEDEFRPPKELATTMAEVSEMALSVGIIEGMTESNRVIKGKIKKKIPWFNDDFGDDFVFEDVVEAITFYKDTNKGFEGLDGEFVVPDSFGGGPFDVDASADAAAAIARADHNGIDRDELIAAEIERIEMEMMSTGLPSDDTDTKDSGNQWPEHLAGMKLSSIVERIRDGSLEVKHLPERKKKLDAIGFDWGDEKKFLDVAFDKAMCAMYAYFLVRGDLFVYEDFVMPDEAPWPKALAGYEIGKAVARIRELQNFFEAYHPHKVKMLRMVEFVWFPELALPLDPDQGEESYEDMFVDGVGHPFYQMNEPSVSVLEKLQEKGPWGPEDDPNSWYNYDFVKEFWEEGDVSESRSKRVYPFDPAEWLRANDFPQLAEEHEQQHGLSDSRHFLALLKRLDNGEIDAGEFDTSAGPLLESMREQMLRASARAKGVEFDEEQYYEDFDVEFSESQVAVSTLEDEEDYEDEEEIKGDVDDDEYEDDDDEYEDDEEEVKEEEVEVDDDDDFNLIEEEEI